MKKQAPASTLATLSQPANAGFTDSVEELRTAMVEAATRAKADPHAILLPSDPEGMNNDRAEWAQEALDAFASATDMDTANEDDETILGDLLADLMHWCDRNRVVFVDMLSRAHVNYAEETDRQGQAGYQYKE